MSTLASVSRRDFLQGASGLLAVCAFASGDAYAQPANAPTSAPEVVDGFPPPRLVGRPMPEKVQFPSPPERRVGFAVVGLGDFALHQILPNLSATKSCRLAALVSGNPEKLQKVGEAYGISKEHRYGYDQLEKLRDDETVDVVYIITPNVFHRDLTERAFKAGKHVLCEKPLATSSEDCEAMIAAGEKAGKTLMVAYRAQFDPYNLEAVKMIREGKVGTPSLLVLDHGRILDPSKPVDQWRAKQALAGGGSLFDIGIYSVNGARYLLGEEPVSVKASPIVRSGRPEVDVEEQISWTMRFPSGAVANCSSSYLVSGRKRFHIQGDKGDITLDPATDYEVRNLYLKTMQGENHSTQELEIPQDNQFAPMLDEMANAILENRQPKTPGVEGLRDLRILEAIYRSAESGREVKLA